MPAVTDHWRNTTTEGDPTTNEYGHVIAAYRGRGILHGESDQETPCEFSGFQLRDGSVFLLTKATDIDAPWLLASHPAESFIGTTEHGQRVTASGLFETNYLPSLAGKEPGAYSAYHCDDISVNSALDRVPYSSIFALTNLTLATHTIAITHPSGPGQLRTVNQYQDRIRRLKTLHGVDTTAELVVERLAVDARDLMADDVCSVLSLACGTKVQWIARTDYSDTGMILRHYHGSRVTKSYCPLPLIDPRQPKDLARFAEAALPAYVARKAQWGLATGLLDAFLDARAEADFLETRGAKLAVAMEMLNTAFLTSEGRPEFVRSESKFGALLPSLKRAVQTVLSSDGWEPSERARVYANLRALNRVPFDKHLDSLCSTLALSLSEADRRLFVRCRNSLVHRGRFYCRTADRKMRQECPPPESPAHEYFWLLHVMDRVFLRLLDYDGPMIDWSQPNDPTRRDTF